MMLNYNWIINDDDYHIMMFYFTVLLVYLNVLASGYTPLFMYNLYG
jgi:hypothetical protein